MSITRIAALGAALAMVMPAVAQDPLPPSAIEQDRAKTEEQAREMMADRHVHWSIKERMEVLMHAPFIRPREQWELMHMFLVLPANQERVVREALTNAIRDRGVAYTQQRTATAVTRTETTTITQPGEPTIVHQRETVSVVPGDARAQQFGFGVALRSALSDRQALSVLESSVGGTDRTALRVAWNNMTSWQRDAMLNTVRNAVTYYDYRLSRGF